MSDVRTEKGDLVDGLRNCPFCGSEARWAVTNIDGDWEIQCSNMGCPVLFIGRDETGRELATAWNTRPELASWQARAEAAEKVVTDLSVERAFLQARAEQAESTIAAWKKDAEDKGVLIAELTAEVTQLKAELADLSDASSGLAELCHKYQDELWTEQKQALSRSTDLEREDGK